MSEEVILAALDSGTQSNRFILYDKDCNTLCSAQIEVPLTYPKAG